MQEASNVYNHQKNHPVGKSMSPKLLSLEKYDTVFGTALFVTLEETRNIETPFMDFTNP